MNVEQTRLQTFSSWPEDAPVLPSRIAREGFYATGLGLEVQCHWCGSQIIEWSLIDQVKEKHRLLNPVCPFVMDPTTTNNVPMSVHPVTTSDTDNTDLKNEQVRLATFKNWPVSAHNPVLHSGT